MNLTDPEDLEVVELQQWPRQLPAMVLLHQLQHQNKKHLPCALQVVMIELSLLMLQQINQYGG